MAIASAPYTGMTFLQLAQEVVRKSGISGAGPATVLSQTGELRRVVGWVNEAWLNIQQQREDWEWMRGSVSFSTVAQQATYTPAQCGIADFAEWAMNTKNCTFRYYVTSEGVRSEIFLTYMDYESWRDTFQYGSLRLSYSRPEFITVCPNTSIGLGQIPDSADYTIVGDYFKTPTVLVEDSDVPAMPARFHMLIVYLAQMYYGEYEQDEYVRATAERNYSRMMARMTIAQLPEVTFGGALA